MAGVAGLTDGSLIELNHQQHKNPDNPIDWVEVAKKGAQKGTIDAITVLPAALAAQKFPKFGF